LLVFLKGPESRAPYTDCIIGFEVIASLTMSLISDSAEDDVPARASPLLAFARDTLEPCLKLNESEGCGRGACGMRLSWNEEPKEVLEWLAGDRLD